MPPRKPDTVLTWRTARELSLLADCDPRTIQAAARGEHNPGEAASRARLVVTEYFEDHPGAQPPGWPRPKELPLPIKVAKHLAALAGVDLRAIQRIAIDHGLSAKDPTQPGTRAAQAVATYLEKHPTAAPTATGGG